MTFLGTLALVGVGMAKRASSPRPAVALPKEGWPAPALFLKMGSKIHPGLPRQWVGGLTRLKPQNI